jgi:hypothetical protein
LVSEYCSEAWAIAHQNEYGQCECADHEGRQQKAKRKGPRGIAKVHTPPLLRGADHDQRHRAANANQAAKQATEGTAFANREPRAIDLDDR